MSESISAIQKAQLEDMLGVLAHIRHRPSMWIGSKDAVALRAFVTGLSIAASSLGIDIEKGREEIWAERGWDTHRSATPIVEMEEKGWSQEAIISETIIMLILNIKRRYDLTGKKILEMHDEIRQRNRETQHEIRKDLEAELESLEKDLGIFKAS